MCLTVTRTFLKKNNEGPGSFHGDLGGFISSWASCFLDPHCIFKVSLGLSLNSQSDHQPVASGDINLCNTSVKTPGKLFYLLLLPSSTLT